MRVSDGASTCHSPGRRTRTNLFFIVGILVVLLTFFVCDVKSSEKKKPNPNDNKGNTPFFLQDPNDEMCLGPNGFTVCDEVALWILTKRVGKATTYSLVSLLNPSAGGLCLDRKRHFFGLLSSDRLGIAPCGKNGAKSWQFEFIDQTHVKLSNRGQCLVRGKKGYKNSATMQTCKQNEFLPLVYHPTAVHEKGFFLKGADGSCFDGTQFRSCDGRGSNFLMWGVGVKYVYGEAKRYFFGFATQDRSNCLVASGKSVSKGDCKDSGALKWGLNQGQLTYNSGKMCLVRKNDDTAALAKTSDGQCEYVTLEVPSSYSEDDIAEMLKSPNLSEKEREVLIEAVNKRSLS